MSAKYLVTTADERTWPVGRPILFLGEWCRLYKRKSVWEKLDAEVIPYHWDDRNKIYRDYQYLQRLYEELLSELSNEVNEIHGTDHSLRYWRIMIGPWLGYFLQMLFDRWSMIECAISRHEISGVSVLNKAAEELIPNDMDNFNSLYVDDLWNESIYGQLLKDYTSIPINKIDDSTNQNRSDSKLSKLTVSRRIKLKLARVASAFYGLILKNDEAFIISPYMPIKEVFRLQWRLEQFPKLWFPFQTPIVEVDWSMRQWRMKPLEEKGFSGIVRSLIPKHIPKLYLEGYRKLRSILDDLPWPKKPRLIFTSISHNSDDVFKAWTAEKVESGTHLVIGQHGGHYGVGKWSFIEDHETAISDRFVSWGWSAPEKPNIMPLGQLKARRPLGIRHEDQSRALLVTAAVPRYSYWMYSVMVSSQWLGYFQDMVSFVENLPESIRDALTVRLFPQDWGWDQENRWRDRFPNLNLDKGQSDLDNLIRKSRLYISTYNATTFLESFSMNVPTVIFWNPDHWELRDSARPYFDELKSASIFHETPISAAQHVTKIWNDVFKWWENPQVQSVREKFCLRFAYNPDKLVDRLEKILHESIDNPKKTNIRK